MGLSQFSIGWTKLEIVHERIQAGRPQQNGRHERMHSHADRGHDETASGIATRNRAASSLLHVQ
jgi:hypothetical protein